MYIFQFISLYQADGTPSPPPLNIVVKEDEHVAKHELHNMRSKIHSLSFFSRSPTLYMKGGGTFSRKDAGTDPTFLVGIVVCQALI